MHPFFEHHQDLLRRVRGVIQAGADCGQEIPLWEATGIEHQLYFEPVPARFAGLQMRPGATKWNLALADYCGRAPFHVTNDLSSSSLSPLFEGRIPPLRGVSPGEIIQVNVVTLDAFFDRHPELRSADFNLLFLDTQGSEDLVIKGATRTLAHIDLIVTEVGYQRMYERCVLFPELDALIRARGFELVAQYPLDGFGGHGDAIYQKCERAG